MSTLSLAWHDSSTMLRRNLRHATRNPSTLLGSVVMPCVLMLLFVFAFGGTMGNGLGGAAQGIDYVDYLAPGIFLLALTVGAMGTSIAVAVDMTKGIINRFKVMDVPRGAVLTGHVIASVLTNLIAVAAIIGVAFALGFDPSASFGQWLGVIGLVVLLGLATGWLTVALGLFAKTPETAGLASVPLVMLPFFSSAIVPADKMGPGVKQFAQYQPFTPIIESLRGLLNGAPHTGDMIAAFAWCLGIAVVGYVWATSTFKKRA